MGVQPSPPKAGSAGPAATSKARSSKETGGTQAAVCTAVLVLLAALVWHVMPLHNWQLLQLHHRVHVADDIIKPVKLHYPIWWQAPFYTGTGEVTCCVLTCGRQPSASAAALMQMWDVHTLLRQPSMICGIILLASYCRPVGDSTGV